MEKGKLNRIMLILECLAYSLMFVFFLCAKILDLFTPEEANIIYIAFVSVTFGYLYLFEFFFRRHDIAVHWKMFGKYYRPAGKTQKPAVRRRKGLAGVAALWILYLGGVWGAGRLGILSWQVFLMGACVMFILNSVFSRKICLLSVVLLKNKNHCCKNCGINSWDYIIFASALFFAPRLSDAATAVNGAVILVSLATFIAWEVLYHRYPERFYPETNAALRCVYCEKQCKWRNRTQGEE